jgi:CheY-like chemotaxis protein
MKMPTQRVIIADHDSNTLQLLDRIINTAGYKTATATNGQDALAKIRILEPSLVFIDAEMPQIDGFQVCQEIRNDPTLTRQPHIILMTDSTQNVANFEKALQLGVNDLIFKPLSVLQVSSCVQKIMN